MASGHVLHFGPRKAIGLRRAGPSHGIAKRVFGVDCNCNDVAATAERTLVTRRNNSLSSGGRFLFLISLAVVVVAISLDLRSTGHGWSCLSTDWISWWWLSHFDTWNAMPETTSA
jgi:hypothetical protein